MPRMTEQLYYEDENGNYLPAGSMDNPYDSIPPGAKYQIAQFARVLRTEWIGLREDGTSGLVMAGNASWSGDLVLAMVRPTWKERLLQVVRYGYFAPVFDIDTAILKAALSCERCMNAMRHRHGIDDGYREDSEEWLRCNTRCSLCEPH